MRKGVGLLHEKPGRGLGPHLAVLPPWPWDGELWKACSFQAQNRIAQASAWRFASVNRHRQDSSDWRTECDFSAMARRKRGGQSGWKEDAPSCWLGRESFCRLGIVRNQADGAGISDRPGRTRGGRLAAPASLLKSGRSRKKMTLTFSSKVNRLTFTKAMDLRLEKPNPAYPSPRM